MRALRHLIVGSLATALAVVSCKDEERVVTEGQLLLYVDTDAPVPSGPGQRPSTVTPLFDRLRIDVFPPASDTPCPGCTNEFEINGLVLGQKKASFGIAPAFETAGYRARVRMFKTDFAAATGEPNADSTIDVTVALPPVDATNKREVSVFLPVESVGQPRGSLADPVPVADGALDRSRVGSWPGAQRVDCAAPAPEGAVCVPGGAYWMGNPNAPGFTPAGYVLQPRLVVISPFYMSANEVTVRRFRRFAVAQKRWTGSSAGSTAADWCTFTAEPGPWEDHPVNCVTFEEARGYCKAVGGDLPTEAQFEYVQGGLVGNVFPWGRDEPTCTDAVYGRAGWGTLATALSPCKPAVPPGSVAKPGEGVRDRLDLPTGTLVDLAGNLNEWVRDRWNRIDEACWSAKLHHDPFCETTSPSDGNLAVHRGGNWSDIAARMIATTRFGRSGTQADAQTGFRCVWPAVPGR